MAKASRPVSRSKPEPHDDPAVIAAKAKTVTEAQSDTPIGKQDIKRSALETWRKLDTVIQNELSLIMKGEKEVTASTAAAVIKFIEASAGLASSSEDLSEKDAKDRQQTLMTNLTLPVFDDEAAD